MQDYDIAADLSEQQQNSLTVLVWLTFLLGLVMAALRANQARETNELPDLSIWICLAASLVVTNILRHRKQAALASWVYVGGLLVIFSQSLVKYGPGPNIYLLFMAVPVVASLLFDKKHVVNIAVLTVGLMFCLTILQTGLIDAISLTAVPIGFVALLSIVLYATATNALETILWATDVQRKDAKRAEEFYQQKLQLNDALLQVTHVNSKLEILNVKLEEAHQKSEQASKAKSVFLSNMSHELRTPLNVIIGYSSTMLELPDMYDGVQLPPAYKPDVQLVQDNGYYLLNLINDILDLSKIEAGKLELHSGPVDLTELFRGVLATSIGLVKDKPLQIRPEYPDNMPRVLADSVRVRQIILNLMSNAIKFTPSGSVTLRAQVEGPNVSISVTDTGIGIAEQALTHIFDRFEQAERDTDKQYGGTGLGLDISKQLAVMHGGDLTVQSLVGQGSTFTFTLPIYQGAEALSEAKDPHAGTSVNVLKALPDDLASTILLVEDEASLRDMMRRTLEGAGHVVVDVQDGSQVLDMASGLLPELIILDIRLPNVNGWQLLSELKANPDTANIPVLICTGTQEQDRARELGAALYLGKPFSSDELLACVQAFLPLSLQKMTGD